MTIRARAILAAVGVAFATGLEGQTVPSLSGTVIDTLGNPVAGATVEVRKVPQNQVEFVGKLAMLAVRAPGDFDFATTAVTSSSGAFSFSNLPAAAYVVCAGFSAGYVNTCAWGRGAVVTVPSATVLQVTATPAAVVSIQVNDAAGLLQAAVETIAMPLLNVGVRTASGAYHGAALSASSSTGRTYTARVLPNQPVTVHASSAKFLLGDATGAPLSSAIVAAATTAAAGQSSAFSITVLGAR